MSSPAAAVTTVEISLVRPCILIVDDDEDFLAKAQEFFLSRDYDVDIATTPEQAIKIIKKNGPDKYQVVAADINFGSSSAIKGDTFVLDNLHLFGKAKKVLISGGEWLTDKRREELKVAGISYLDKNPSLNKKLVELTKEANQKQKHDIEHIVKSVTVPRIKELVGGPVDVRIVTATVSPATKAIIAKQEEARISPYDTAINKLKVTLIRWLKSRSDPDKPVLAYGKHVYSANDMIKEVENETEVGIKHIRTMIRLFEYSLGMHENDSRNDGNAE